MMRKKVIDNFDAYESKMNLVIDKALGKMASDTANVAKIRVPFKDGNLMEAIEVVRKGFKHFWVLVDEAYAAFQERGERFDGSLVVKRYTTPNTGKDYLKNAGSQVTKDFTQYIKQAINSIRLGL